MKLAKYVDDNRKEDSRRVFLTALHNKCKVSLSTLQQCVQGYRMDSYSKANAISKATKGVVSIKELCEQ